MVVVEGEGGANTLSETQGYLSLTLVVTGVLNDSETGEVTCVNESKHELWTHVTDDTDSYQ